MILKKILSLTMVFAMLLCLCACADNEDLKQENLSYSTVLADIASKFLVTVVDDDGNVVEGVILQIRKNSGFTARTNKEGVATFPLVITEGYKLSVIQCPEGYEYTGKNNIPMSKDTREYTVEISKKVGENDEY